MHEAPATKAAQRLAKEIQAANRSLERCHCGSAVTMQYTPGCTFIWCHAEGQIVANGPDWCPTELAEHWNSCPESVTS